MNNATEAAADHGAQFDRPATAIAEPKTPRDWREFAILMCENLTALAMMAEQAGDTETARVREFDAKYLFAEIRGFQEHLDNLLAVYLDNPHSEPPMVEMLNQLSDEGVGDDELAGELFLNWNIDDETRDAVRLKIGSDRTASQYLQSLVALDAV